MIQATGFCRIARRCVNTTAPLLQLLSAFCQRSKRTTLLFVVTGMIRFTPSSVAFCTTRSMRSPRDTPCTSATRERRLAVNRRCPLTATSSASLSMLRARCVLAAAAINESHCIADADPKNAHDAMGGFPRQGRRMPPVRARSTCTRVSRMPPFSMPSRATLNHESISSG